MNKKKISLFILVFLLTLITLVSFANPPEALNHLITENPYKEVKTVTADKTRENAEMNISVNKLNLKPIDTYQLSENEYYIDLPKDNKLSLDEVYFISKNIEEIPDISNVNGKKIISNINKFKDYSIETADFNYIQGDNFILIDKAPALINNFIVSRLNRKTGETSQVYLAKDFKKTSMTRVDGVVIDGAPHIIFKLSDEILEELTNEKKEIKIGKNFRDVFNQKNINKRGIGETSVNDEIKYKIDKEKKILLIENREDISEIRIMLSDNNGIRKIYGGSVFLSNIVNTSRSAYLQYAPYKKPKIKYKTDGTRVLQFGEFIRVNYIINSDTLLTDDGLFRFNYSALPNTVSGKQNTLAKSGSTYVFSSNLSSLGLLSVYKFLDRPQSATYGNEQWAGRLPYMSSKEVVRGQVINLGETFVTIATNRPIYGSTTGWALGFGIEISLSNDEYNEIRKYGYNIVQNVTDIYFEIRSWETDVLFKDIVVSVLSAGKIYSTFEELELPPVPPPILTSNGKIELQNPLLKKEDSSGGIFIHQGDGTTLIAQTQGSIQNIKSSTGDILRFKPELGYLGSSFVNVSGKVISGNGAAVQTKSYPLNMSSLASTHLNNVPFIDGKNKLTVSYPNATANKGGMVIGIDKWDLLEGEYEAIIEHPYIVNKTILKLPNFSSSVYYTPISNKEIIKTFTDRENNSLGEFLLETKPYNVDILGTLPNGMSRFGYKVKKILPATINGITGSGTITTEVKTITSGTVLDEGDYWYILAPLTNISNQSINTIIELKTDIPVNNQTIEVSIPGIIEIGVKDQTIGREEVINKIKITEISTKLPEGISNISFDSNNFAMVEYGGGYNTGWGIVHPTSSSDINTKIGYIDTNGLLIIDSRKNNQFKQLKATGEMYPLTSLDLGKKIKFTIGEKTKEVTLNPNPGSNPMSFINFNDIQGIGIGIDYEPIPSFNGGMYLGFYNWDLEAKIFDIKVESNSFINKYNVKIPEFNGEIYYNKNIPQLYGAIIDYTEKKLKGDIIRDTTGNIILPFNIGSKDYDLRALGSNSLTIKIPKKIFLELTDIYGAKERVEFITKVTEITGTLIDDGDFYLIKAPNNGQIENSEIRGLVTLERVPKSINLSSVTSILGSNLDLVSIGSISSNGAEKRSTMIDSIEIIEKPTITKGNMNISLSNPVVKGTENGTYGRIRVYSNPSIKIGYLDNNNKIITDNIKNNQYIDSAKISGTYIPIIPTQLGGTKGEIIFNAGGGDIKKEMTLYLNNDQHADGILYTVDMGNQNGIRLAVDYQHAINSNYGTDISLTEWDLEEKNIMLTMKHPLIENTFNIKIPEFNGEKYYDKSISQSSGIEIDYTNKKLKGEFLRDSKGFINIPFKIASKDYDASILETERIAIKIPKKINLRVRDINGVETNIKFETNIENEVGTLINSDPNFFILKSQNNGRGVNQDSSIKGIVSLGTSLRSSNLLESISSITGDGLNLVSIGSSYKNKEKYSTIVDSIDAKVRLNNFHENIDVSSLKLSEKKYTTTNFIDLLQDENKLILKNEKNKIFESTVADLSTKSQKILNSGVSIKYNLDRGRFEFIKDEYLTYEEKLELEVRTSTGLLLYTVNINLTNDSGFEILPGKGSLNFGHFIPGDIKKAERLIEFKNLSDANIQIELSNKNDEYIYKIGEDIRDNTKILLSNIGVKDLNSDMNKTNNFLIFAEATTTKFTEPGEYKGNLEVIITIVP